MSNSHCHKVELHNREREFLRRGVEQAPGTPKTVTIRFTASCDHTFYCFLQAGFMTSTNLYQVCDNHALYYTTSHSSRESHYSRQDNMKRRYLPESLSIARMYRLFLEKYEPEINEEDGEKPRVKEWLYRKV